MTRPSFLTPRVLRHAIGWLLIVSLFTYLNRVVLPGQFRVFGLPYSLPVLLGPALAIYAHYWLLSHQLEHRRYGWYLAGTVAAILLGSAVLAAVGRHVDPRPHSTVVFGKEGPGVVVAAAPKPWPAEFGQAAANVVTTLLLATVARYTRRGIKSYYQVQQLHARQLETELSLLKAQVNQHFLFNTLNNLYGLSLAAPDQIPEALLQLADLLRYQLDSSRQARSTVGSEADYLRNYIGLEKLRLRAGTEVEFQAELPHPDHPLAPLLLLPLVENCFKHAVGPEGAGFIRIGLVQTATSLTLRTENSVPAHFRPAPSGVGLPTLRARLAQFYPGARHQLRVEATPGYYAATLQLSL
ncbi:histidine kinase [Hymenobacter sp. RP-2-7]|uniref:Histidine kinase n=1 Tax=Hymenobacter polaris TaxID=2682546 RepID=A0A7Y0AAF7_9BACT|nr:sensor histidine kinase [Hymenobacter polaris]NML63759.1 histidine kinase [Hymenobacter polaris]